MPNTEYSKLKLLYLYHYFRKYVAAEGPGDETTMGEMMAYLNKMTGAEFERKSIYSDIDRLNEFARSIGICEPDEQWIELEGRKYKRGEAKGDLTSDEAKLIVDAINATDFIDSGLCEKIKGMYPLYFEEGYRSVMSHDNKQVRKSSMIYLLANVRKAIQNEEVMGIEYGYVLGSGISGTTSKTVSPMGLDFKNSRYYLIAVDNDAVEAGVSKNKAIRTYRLDRIKSARILKKPFIGFDKKRDSVLEKYMKDSLNEFSYSGSDSRTILITLRSSDEKALLKAYTALTDEMKTKLLTDRADKGELKFYVESGLVPPFFNILFKVCMYENVDMTIDDPEVKAAFKKYLNKAGKVCRS
ncbi:MAG: WYL domain-containing protein [Clostridiales bacterium]|nr:WYL domain-containing protein [Clostridiales bacterium]